MQFQVPQFIEIEDKIIGPLTLKQFLYLIGAGGFSFILFFILQTWLWIAITIILVLFAAGLAFIKYNGRPMIVMLIAALKYIWMPKFYLWKTQTAYQQSPKMQTPEIQKTKRHPLKDLFLKLTTSKKAIPRREKALPKNTPTQG